MQFGLDSAAVDPMDGGIVMRARLPSGILAACAISSLISALPDLATAQPSARGRWTSKLSAGACWGTIDAGYCNGPEPVHMVLTRSNGYHSQILWYESHQHLLGDLFEGGIWGWNPGTTTATKDCSAYPEASITKLSASLFTPAYNIFCSGAAVLGDGRVLISGGTQGGEAGGRRPHRS